MPPTRNAGPTTGPSRPQMYYSVPQGNRILDG